MASITFKSEPVTCVGETEPYRPIEVKDGKTAMHAVMSIFMNHSAEVFHGVVDAISDHYKIPKDEMMDVILSHPAYTQIGVNPILNDLYYLRPEAVKPESEEKPEPAPKPKKRYVVKKAVAPAAAPEPEQHVPPEGGEGKAEPERQHAPQKGGEGGQHAPPKKFQPKKVAPKPV